MSGDALCVGVCMIDWDAGVFEIKDFSGAVLRRIALAEGA